jgi:hypothetical protein
VAKAPAVAEPPSGDDQAKSGTGPIKNGYVATQTTTGSKTDAPLLQGINRGGALANADVRCASYTSPTKVINGRDVHTA